VLEHVILPAEVDALLSALQLVGAPVQAGGFETGTVTLVGDLSNSPIPGFDLALALPQPGLTLPYKLQLEPAGGAPTSFRVWLALADETHALAVFRFANAVPGFALTGAARVIAPDGSVSLRAVDPTDAKHVPVLVSGSSEPGAALGPALLVAGSDGAPASIRFAPDTDSTEGGVVALALEPSTVVFGTSTIGFDCPAVVIDDSETDKAPGTGAPALDPPLASIDADTPAWRGILARELDFFLPADVPLFGGHPINGYFAVPSGTGGVELVVETKVPAHNGRPEFGIRIESLDPTASGLSGLVPTLIAATMELPLDGKTTGFTDDGGLDQQLTFGAGKPVRATATLSRDPVNSPGVFKVVVAIAGQGRDGLLSVTSNGMGGAKIFNTTAALATALIADKNVARTEQVGNTTGVALYALAAAGTVLSSLFTDDSQFVLHGVEVESTGHGAPVGGAIALTLDYSVALRVTQVDIGVLHVSMNPNQPMRIRIRKARMSVDPNKSGLRMIGLDFDHASMEVEDPGAWNVSGLDSLFDVLGSRSGRGSSWIEVDLGFKLNLGPVKVSGATVRATLTPSGDVEASLSGLEAGLEIPGAIDGSGSVRILDPKGFAADLRASIVPLNLAADAGIVYAPPMVLLHLDVDLPAPIPLANTGFGLMGIGGLLGFSARPDYESVPGETDPVARQLEWQPNGASSFKPVAGQSSFGVSAAVGTLPDLGFTFSAKAGILITAPDIAVRGSLNGRVLQPPVKMTDPNWPPSAGISFVGFVAVDSDALSFGLFGEVNLKPLLDVRVPIAGHFPFQGDTSDWYTYLGADGAPVQGRSIGPISARVLPDVVNVGADAYFMVRGKGMLDWPYGRRLLSISDGFVVAFGFSLQNTFGVKPVVWAELYASLDLLIASKPPTLAGFGQAGGSLNLGPFSLGVQAQVKFILAEAIQYFWAEVTGRIELFFFDIEGKVTIAFGDKDPPLALPAPDRHPLDRYDEHGARTGSLGALTDDSYRKVAELVEDPQQAQTVWPDAIVSLPFAAAPEINAASAGAQFPGVLGPGATPPPQRLGTEMLHYNWRLETVTLRDVTDEADKVNGAGTPPPGQLAARWQVPRSGPGGSDVNELLLLSTGPDLWVNRLADSGAGAGDPLKADADVCNAQPREPETGWAVGFLAESDVAGYRLPPDPVSADPRVSRVDVHLNHHALYYHLATFGTGLFELSLDTVHSLPEPYTLDPAQLVAWPTPATIRRRFDGHLVAPNLHWLAGEAVDPQGGGLLAQAISLTFQEPIVGGTLILVADVDLLDRDWLTGLHIHDDANNAWTNAHQQALPTGQNALVVTQPTADPASRLDISYPLGVALGVVGIGGVTVRARDAATRERDLLTQEVARRAAAAQQGPRQDPHTNAPHQRAILDPGRLYRLELDLTWAGELSQQNDAGQITAKDKVAFGDQRSHLYTSGNVVTTKRLFFRTAAHVSDDPPPEGAGTLQTSLITWLLRKQDAFKAEMLQRYLAGYEPAQSEQFRFRNDALRAHFLQDHVVALARAYDYDLEVARRRVDKAGTAYDQPIFASPLWSFATNPAFLSPTDAMRFAYAMASDCEVAPPGSSAAVADPALEPEAWYEVYVRAKSNQPAFADGRLPGVTFHTSRWLDPADMLVGLGLATSGRSPAGVVNGDVVVTPSAVTPDVALDDDQAFVSALESLQLHSWPPVTEPRLSRLWVPGPSPSYLFAGLLLESPEPIHRTGRFTVDGLTLQMGAAGAAVQFVLARRDRAGARLLFLTPTPFQVVTREWVRRPQRLFGGRPARFPFGGNGFVNGVRPEFTDITPTLPFTGTSTANPAGPVSGTTVLTPQPAFAEDP